MRLQIAVDGRSRLGLARFVEHSIRIALRTIGVFCEGGSPGTNHALRGGSPASTHTPHTRLTCTTTAVCAFVRLSRYVLLCHLEGARGGSLGDFAEGARALSAKDGRAPGVEGEERGRPTPAAGVSDRVPQVQARSLASEKPAMSQKPPSPFFLCFSFFSVLLFLSFAFSRLCALCLCAERASVRYKHKIQRPLGWFARTAPLGSPKDLDPPPDPACCVTTLASSRYRSVCRLAPSRRGTSERPSKRRRRTAKDSSSARWPRSPLSGETAKSERSSFARRRYTQQNGYTVEVRVLDRSNGRTGGRDRFLSSNV